MKQRPFLPLICLLLLVSLIAVPVLAATVTCPSSCSCLLPADAKKSGSPGYCSGKQAVCGYDTQKNEKYCYTKASIPTTTTKTVNPTTTVVTRLVVTSIKPVSTTTVTTKPVITTVTTTLPVMKITPVTTTPAGSQVQVTTTVPAAKGSLPPAAVSAATRLPPTSNGKPVAGLSLFMAKITGADIRSSTPSQLTLCNGSLVSVWTDPANCGSCGAFCAEGLVCSMGQCIYSTGPSTMQSPCSAFHIQCNGTCISYLHDDGNCGRCGNRCGVFETCCSGRCTNTNSDPDNCHACGNRCGADATCTFGVCSCTNSTTQCGTRCVSLLTDNDNCGGCNIRCSEGKQCCNSICTDTTRDLNNCGTCNHICVPYSCIESHCRDLLTDEEHCGTTNTRCGEHHICCSGRCMDYKNDNNNCGSCGNECGTGETCCNGACVAFSSYQTDEGNCGGCGQKCNQPYLGSDWYSETCCGGRCIDPDWDDNNCGSCGNACPWSHPHCTDSYCYNLFEVLLSAI